ncbi:sensor histidine kinase [Floricoccus penangensis]|uniref:sensor histidine kinase n=1 Tax=Floricoccus penangensis TaxID=1859475 RepID=UPI00203B7ED6|nr:GHKL domain-containing protein [Floricoccus penangensis]URZ88043.1 GHKL domain-containing protein [Floricoccus penangensis]
MFLINSQLYYGRLFFDSLLFFFLFFNIHGKFKNKNIIAVVFLLICNFLIEYLLKGYYNSLPDILLITSCFLIFKRQEDNINDLYLLLNSLLLSKIIIYSVRILIRGLVLPYMASKPELHELFYSLEYLFNVIFIMIAIKLYKKYRFSKYLNRQDIALTGLFIYLLLSIIIFIYFANKFQEFKYIASGLFIFLLIQFILIILICTKEFNKKRMEHEDNLLKKRVEVLKFYTNKLEKEQLELKKFKHDYKNLLLSLKDSIESNELSSEAIEEFQKYSSRYLNSDTDHSIDDIVNIKNVYLKSLLLEKIAIINQKNIFLDFECKTIIDEEYIPIFDLIRIIGISIDNAIEGTTNIENGKIKIFIYQTKKYQEFLIQNSFNDSQEQVNKFFDMGFSTKKLHGGFGLSNVQEIIKKYPNIFIEYTTNIDFTVQILIN